MAARLSFSAQIVADSNWLPGMVAEPYNQQCGIILSAYSLA